MESTLGGVVKNFDETQSKELAVRLNIELSNTNLRKNVFNYRKELSLALGQTNPDQTDCNIKDLYHNPEDDKKKSKSDKPKGKGNKRRFDPEDEYDLYDDFVDDSDLFLGEVNYTPPKKWDYGFFAWRGSIENFFKSENEVAEPKNDQSLSRTKKNNASAKNIPKKTPNNRPNCDNSKRNKPQGQKIADATKTLKKPPKKPSIPTNSHSSQKSTTAFSNKTTKNEPSNHTKHLKNDDDLIFKSKTTTNLPPIVDSDKNVTFDIKESSPDVKASKEVNAISEKLSSTDQIHYIKKKKRSTMPFFLTSTPDIGADSHISQNSSDVSHHKIPKIDDTIEPSDTKTYAFKHNHNDSKDSLVIFFSPDLHGPDDITCNIISNIFSISPHDMFKATLPISIINSSRRKAELCIKKFKEYHALESHIISDDRIRSQKKLLLSVGKYAMGSGLFSSSLIDALKPYSNLPTSKMKSIIIIPIAKHLQKMQEKVDRDYFAFEKIVKDEMVSQFSSYENTKHDQYNNVVYTDTPALETGHKFNWPDNLQYLFWQIVNEEWVIAKWYTCLSGINNVEYRYTKTSIRDAVYKKIIQFWPKNWMSIDQLLIMYNSIIDKIKSIRV